MESVRKRSELATSRRWEGLPWALDLDIMPHADTVANRVTPMDFKQTVHEKFAPPGTTRIRPFTSRRIGHQ